MLARIDTYLRRISITSGSSRSLHVAGIFSLLASLSAAAAASIFSRRRDTSSSAARSRTSSSLFRFFCREVFFGFKIASICISNRALLAARVAFVRLRMHRGAYTQHTFLWGQLRQIHFLALWLSLPLLLCWPPLCVAVPFTPPRTLRLRRSLLLHVVIARLA